MTSPGFIQVALALILVAISIAIVRYWRIPVAKDMALGSVRAFVQLIAVGYALEFIFDLRSTPVVLAALMVMILVGAQTAAGRDRSMKRAFLINFAAMLTGSLITITVMVLIKIITIEARYIIPLGGMIIGNSMNASALVIERLNSDIGGNRLAIETSLSLGKSWRAATKKYTSAAATAGMISILNFMKTVGIVALPGAMTGMILAGAEPLEAVLLQIVVGYMLLSAVTITSIVAVELTVRQHFTSAHQLRRQS